MFRHTRFKTIWKNSNFFVIKIQIFKSLRMLLIYEMNMISLLVGWSVRTHGISSLFISDWIIQTRALSLVRWNKLHSMVGTGRKPRRQQVVLLDYAKAFDVGRTLKWLLILTQNHQVEWGGVLLCLQVINSPILNIKLSGTPKRLPQQENVECCQPHLGEMFSLDFKTSLYMLSLPTLESCFLFFT